MKQEVYYHSYHNRDRLVHIVDSDVATCEALSVLFRLEGFQTTLSHNSADFFASIERRSPDVVVLNLEIDSVSSAQDLRKIKQACTGAPVFMLADKPNIEAAVDAMKSGATDVISKPIDTEKFVRAVREALRRDVHLGAVQGGRRPIEIRGFNQLTPREREVLQLISNGQSNKEAGRDLGISPRTIEVHRARVMEKLGARNTADLMRIILTG